MTRIIFLSYFLITSTIALVHGQNEFAELFLEKGDDNRMGKIPHYEAGNFVNKDNEAEVYRIIVKYLESKDKMVVSRAGNVLFSCAKAFSDSLKREAIEKSTEIMLSKFEYKQETSLLPPITGSFSYSLGAFDRDDFSSDACANLLKCIDFTIANRFSPLPLFKLFAKLKFDGAYEKLKALSEESCIKSSRLGSGTCKELYFALARMGDEKGLNYIIADIEQRHGWEDIFVYRNLELIKNRRLVQIVINNVLNGVIKDSQGSGDVAGAKGVWVGMNLLRNYLVGFPLEHNLPSQNSDEDIKMAMDWLKLHQYDFEIKP